MVQRPCVFILLNTLSSSILIRRVIASIFYWPLERCVDDLLPLSLSSKSLESQRFERLSSTYYYFFFFAFMTLILSSYRNEPQSTRGNQLASDWVRTSDCEEQRVGQGLAHAVYTFACCWYASLLRTDLTALTPRSYPRRTISYCF